VAGGVGKIERFEDLLVWQVGREIARGVYRAAKTQPLARDRVLADQMKRAAVSIASNVAEGFERGTRKQNIEFCYIAKGSAGELRSHVHIAHDNGLIDDKASAWLLDRCENCSRMLAGYIRHLQATKTTIAGLKFEERQALQPSRRE
jgi:four helix bundle protein